MIKTKVIRKKGKIEKLLKNLNSLSANNLQIGHFEDGKNHGDSDITNVELLQLWSAGATQSGVIKNPLANFTFTQISNKGFLRNAKVRQVYKKWSKNLLREGASEAFLMEMGEVLREEYSDIFGKAGLFMPITEATSTPLLDTGELKSKAAYKSSYNNKVKEIGSI